jgi:hypothetical protein
MGSRSWLRTRFPSGSSRLERRLRAGLPALLVGCQSLMRLDMNVALYAWPALKARNNW